MSPVVLILFLIHISAAIVPFAPYTVPCACACPQRTTCPQAATVCPATAGCKQSYPIARAFRRRNRHKRALSSDPFLHIDTNCNSEKLRQIIIKKADRVTSVSKRQIQNAAEAELGGRYNVICARGDFSYITNTEVFCQQTVGDVTCYAFKQLSDVNRMT